MFGESLVKEAREDDKIVAVTAAMPSGTGSICSARNSPTRTFDVGIAEQHARHVRRRPGDARATSRSCAIYSTFLQRAYDQVVHDVAIQNLPVRFALDRAGLVGADGPTHAGSFDVAYLGCLPNMVVDGRRRRGRAGRTWWRPPPRIDTGPIAFRYPRGEGVGVDTARREGVPLEIGKGRMCARARAVALLSLGTRLAECLKAADELPALGLSATVADARFAKPLDTDLVETPGPRARGADHRRGRLDRRLRLLRAAASRRGGPARPRPARARHGAARHLSSTRTSPSRMYAAAGLDAEGIVAKVLDDAGRRSRQALVALAGKVVAGKGVAGKSIANKA